MKIQQEQPYKRMQSDQQNAARFADRWCEALDCATKQSIKNAFWGYNQTESSEYESPENSTEQSKDATIWK